MKRFEIIVTTALAVTSAAGLLFQSPSQAQNTAQNTAQSTPEPIQAPCGTLRDTIRLPEGVSPSDPTRGGKYSQLMHILTVSEDCESYGSVYDWGYWGCTEYAGNTQLNPGYWVYIAPKWYVYKFTTEPIVGTEASELE